MIWELAVDLFGPELIRLLDYMGCATFAATGALAAARRKHDIVTFLFFAGITAVGGGTLRDLLMDVPVFWLNQPAYLVICAVVATAATERFGEAEQLGLICSLTKSCSKTYAYEDKDV